MCGYIYIGFIDFKLKGKRFLHYTNLLSPNDCEKNDQIILKLYIYIYIYICIYIYNVNISYIYIYINGKPKIYCIFEKTLGHSIVSRKCKNEDKKIF